MFKVKVSDDIINHCNNQLELYNFGKRKEANGTKEQQLTGIIGQSVVMDIFEEGYVDGSLGFDGGIDLVFFDYKIDVKTMGRNCDAKSSYTNNFLKLQDSYDTDIYIFCSYNKLNQEVTICGWIDKKSFEKKRKYYPKGSIRNRTNGTSFETFSDLYEIDNNEINDVLNPLDLKMQIIRKKIKENDTRI